MNLGTGLGEPRLARQVIRRLLNSSYAFSDEGWSHQNPWVGEDASGAVTSPEPEPEGRRVRRARLRLSRIDPWSVMKMSFLFSALGGIVIWVAVSVLWGVVEASGVFDSVNKAASSLFSGPGQEEFRIQKFLSANKVLDHHRCLNSRCVPVQPIHPSHGRYRDDLDGRLITA